jgi:hypothetical protein
LGEEIKQYGEYRTRRLVLEAWERLEGMEIGNPDGYRQASSETSVVIETKEAEEPKKERNVKEKPVRIEAQNPPDPQPALSSKQEQQPMLSDFGLYKCQACGKMVMGYEKEDHVREKHRSQAVEWKKIR